MLPSYLSLARHSYARTEARTQSEVQTELNGGRILGGRSEEEKRPSAGQRQRGEGRETILQKHIRNLQLGVGNGKHQRISTALNVRRREETHRIDNRSVERWQREEVVEDGDTSVVTCEEKRSDSRLRVRRNENENSIACLHRGAQL